MPNSDPRDRFFYTNLTLMMDSYNVLLQNKLCDDEKYRLRLV